MAHSIEAYFGIPGSGKTYLLMRNLVNKLQYKSNRNRNIFSNIELDINHLKKISRWQGRLYILEDLNDFVDASNGIVILDEINLWAPSRLWAKIPQSVLWKWSQLRKFKLDILITAQHPKRVDSVVRELIWYSYHMQSFVKAGFFFYECFLGVKTKRTNIGLAMFNKKVAKVYDTEKLIGIPKELQADYDIKNEGGKEKMQEVYDNNQEQQNNQGADFKQVFNEGNNQNIILSNGNILINGIEYIPVNRLQQNQQNMNYNQQPNFNSNYPYNPYMNFKPEEKKGIPYFKIIRGVLIVIGVIFLISFLTL